MNIDLSSLPPPNVIEPLDFESIFEARKARLIELTPLEDRPAMVETLALESEPITILLQENAYRELILRQRVNESARAVLLAFSQRGDLDHLAANYDVERLEIQPGNPSAVPPVPALFEGDPDLRYRAQLAFEGLSVAGPRMAYIFHARSADGRVADISAQTPAPAEALITVLSREGNGTAPPDLIAAVEAALSDEDIRPLADRVTVQSAEIIPYAIVATLHLYPGPEVEPIHEAAIERLATYISEQRRIGRDIRRSAIFAALHVDGVQRVELTAPAADVVITPSQAAWCSASSVLVGDPDE